MGWGGGTHLKLLFITKTHDPIKLKWKYNWVEELYWYLENSLLVYLALYCWRSVFFHFMNTYAVKSMITAKKFLFLPIHFPFQPDTLEKLTKRLADSICLSICPCGPTAALLVPLGLKRVSFEREGFKRNLRKNLEFTMPPASALLNYKRSWYTFVAFIPNWNFSRISQKSGAAKLRWSEGGCAALYFACYKALKDGFEQRKVRCAAKTSKITTGA